MKTLNKISFAIVFLLLVSTVLSGANNASAEVFSSATPTTNFTFTRDITVGINGNNVSVLQQFLITGGFLKIPTPTGYFGPTTKTALSAWQTKSGIYPSTGFFGPISRGKVKKITKMSISQSPMRDAIGTTTSTTTPKKTTGAANVSTTNTGNGSPIRMKIPKINVDASVQYNGLKSDGTMEIPDNITDVGWFTGSPHPGENGASVMTGHVAQIRGGIMTKPGVFYNLNELRPGELIYVLNDKEETTTFVVRESRSYDPTADATDVFIAKDNGVHLNIITCEGTWNPGKLSYSQRLVIFADLAQ